MPISTPLAFRLKQSHNAQTIKKKANSVSWIKQNKAHYIGALFEILRPASPVSQAEKIYWKSTVANGLTIRYVAPFKNRSVQISEPSVREIPRNPDSHWRYASFQTGNT